MTPLMFAAIIGDLALIVIALGVLRLYQPRQLATAQQTTLEPINRRDVIYIDTAKPGAGYDIHRAERASYRFIARTGTIAIYERNGTAIR